MRKKTKICGLCREELPATEEFFSGAPRNSDGHQGRCRTCQNLSPDEAAEIREAQRLAADSIFEVRKRTGKDAVRINDAVRKCITAEIEDWNDLVIDEHQMKLAEDGRSFHVVPETKPLTASGALSRIAREEDEEEAEY